MQAGQRSIVLARIANGTYRWEAVDSCLCGSREAVTLSEKERFGFPVGAVACVACGLVRSTPRLAADNLPAFYEHDYHALHMGILDPGPETPLVRPGQGSAVYAFVAPHLPPGDLRVAEVGAGNGSVLRDFARRASQDGRQSDLIGCEYASAFAQVAKSSGIDVRQGGIEVLLDLPPPDVLILSHVLEHLPDPTVELRSIRRWLHPSSLVYIEVPGLLTLHKKSQYNYDFLRYLTLAHNFHFTLGSLEAILNRSGFRLLAGDEEVRSLFAVSIESGQPRARYVSAAELTSYLRGLERSPGLKVRRAWRFPKPRLRRLAAGLLGEERLRRLLARYRGAPR